MVYRSSKGPAPSEEQFNLQESMDSGDSDKGIKFKQQNGRWKTAFLLLLIICLALIVTIVVLVVDSKDSAESVPLCGKTTKTVPKIVDLSEPDKPGPFHDLTKREINNILDYLRKDPKIKIVDIEKAKMTDSVVFMMDLLPAKKAEVRAYLDGNRNQPERHARVIVFRGDLNPPKVHEYDCGPLPKVTGCDLIKSPSRRNPVEFAVRPLMPNEVEAVYTILFKRVDEQIGFILQESYGMSYYNCTHPRCLRFYPSPMGTNLVNNATARRIWIWAAYPVEYYCEHNVDFGMLANLDGSDPTKYHIYNIWYHGQFFASVNDFVNQYKAKTIKMSRVTPPSFDPKDSFSSLFRRGKPLPETPQRPPTLIEPDGKRYSVKHREVEYLGWKFNFRMSPLTGPSLSNIRYKGELIAYELSLAEIAVFYSANNPMQRSTDYLDSGALIGTHSKSLIPGGDCPDTATFINQTFPGQSSTEPVELDRTFCLFENNHGYPLRRHLAYSQYEGAFYGGMLDSALTLRSIQTVVNYDYVIDFIFHQTGTIQTRVMSTGYILSTSYNKNERPYGFHTQKDFVANIHHHMFNFKVDLDISGSENRYETLDIKPDTVNLRVEPKPEYHQTRFDRTLHETEKDALYKFNFETPKYHLVHNNAKRTEYGEMKAYRILLNGMSKQLVPEGKNNEVTMKWARYQMAVTQHKDDEQVSSSPYAMFDSFNPVTDFSTFYEDDENIKDKDLVFWITCGVHHIPHAEDLPITPTIGNHLSFVLAPYNYYKECPSFASRDHVRINLKDPKKPTEGVNIDRHGYVDEQCRTPQYATEYEQLLRDNPDAAVESRKHKGLF